MIDIERERRNRTKPDNEGLRTATDDQIKLIISEKVATAVKELGKKISIFPISSPEVRITLFSFNTNDHDSSVFNAREEMTVEAKRLQDVGFNAIKELGLDESKPTQIPTSGLFGGWAESRLKITNFPSKYDNLSFQREITYGSGINCKVIESVQWSIVGKRPHLKVFKTLIR